MTGFWLLMLVIALWVLLCESSEDAGEDDINY